MFGFLLVAELLCRVLPVSSATMADYYIDPRILTYAPHHPWRYSTGWDLRNPQALKTNGHGFVSDHEFTRNTRAIALIGDSYVEAASLDAADRPAAQLELALGRSRPVYAMGSAGTALLDYAERIRYAHEELGVRDFVVLMERGDVVQSLCGSGNVASQCLDSGTLEPRTEPLAPATPLKRALRQSALAQYLVSQLKISPAKLVGQIFRREVPAEPGRNVPASSTPSSMPPSMREVDVVAATFFARVTPHVPGRLVIVVDADRQALMKHREVDDPKRRRFIMLARAAGATVIDTEPMFRAHFAASTISLDLGPHDGHLNPLGVRLVTASMAKALSE
jgi:hypothetical protein